MPKIVCFLACLLVFSAVSTQAQQPPIENFSNLPVGGFQLSPSGKQIAYFMPKDGRQLLIIHNLDGSDLRVVPPFGEDMELTGFFWKADDLVIFDVSMTVNRANVRGITNEGRTIAYDLAEKKVAWLGRPRRNHHGGQLSQYEQVVDYLIDDPDHILLGLDYEFDGLQTVYKTNVRTARRTVFHKQKYGVTSWFTDDNGVIRYGFGYKQRGKERNYRFLNADGKWQDYETADFQGYELIGLGPEVGQIYALSNDDGPRSLVLLNVETQEVVETLYSHPEVDVDSMSYHPATRKIIGVEYVDDFDRVHYFDDDFAVVQRSLQKALPDMVVKVTNKAKDANLYMVFAHNDKDPGTYYLYNRDQLELTYYSDYRTEIDPNQSGATTRVDIPVQDGTTIPAYLTLPPGEAKPRAAIVLPHGGPSARDSADWDYWSQFLSSRGYAVLKPNFRGSTGYGRSYQDAGFRQWGGRMQQDVTDATHWLIEQKIALPNKICIAGASYGGYAAVMGVIQHPDLYACAVTVNGVLNLPRLKAQDKRYVGGRSWIARMGLEGVKDKEVSPHHQLKRIETPVLVVASENDSRIDYMQSKDFHKKLKRAKKDSTYVQLKTGDHYMLNSESRHGMLVAMEEFLAKHLGE